MLFPNDSPLFRSSPPSSDLPSLSFSDKSSPFFVTPKQDQSTLHSSKTPRFNFNTQDVDNFFKREAAVPKTKKRVHSFFQKDDEEPLPIVDKPAEKRVIESSLSNERELERKIIKKSKPGGFKFLLNHVYFALADIFNGKETPINQYELKPYEISLVRFVLAKKLKNKVEKEILESIDLYKEMHLVFIRKILNSQKVKKRRKDEQIKFIFSLIMKHVKKKYIAEENIEERDFDERNFLSFYFKKQSEEKEIDLLCFTNPMESTGIKNPRFKYCNNEYLNLVFSNSKFREASLSFMSNRLERDYKVKVWKKFHNLFSELRVKLKNTEEDKKEEVIKKYVEKSQKKKFVLPWTCWEVEEAKEKFFKQIAKIPIKK